MVKCTKFDFRCGSAPDPLAGFKAPTSKGREAKMEGRGRMESGRKQWGPYYYERGKKEEDIGGREGKRKGFAGPMSNCFLRPWEDQTQTHPWTRQISRDACNTTQCRMDRSPPCLSELLFFSFTKTPVAIIVTFSHIYISQGSVNTHLRCGGVYNNHGIANCPHSLPVKEFWKSVNNWQKYGQTLGGTFLWPTVYVIARWESLLHCVPKKSPTLLIVNWTWIIGF